MLSSLILALALAAAAPAPAASPAATALPRVPEVPTLFHRAVAPPAGHAVEAVLLGPLFEQIFACTDHAEGNVGALGDAFGTDCMIVGGLEQGDEHAYLRFFREDGKRNEDWYGWHANVLAPFDGRVVGIMHNDVTNVPGTMGKSPPGGIVFLRDDGLVVVYGHLDNVQVKEGDHVKAGQVVAVDGNNGMARSPHVHVGAFRDTTPYQIRWDQRAEGRMDGFQ
jgi:hypothetical protein